MNSSWVVDNEPRELDGVQHLLPIKEIPLPNLGFERNPYIEWKDASLPPEHSGFYLKHYSKLEPFLKQLLSKL